jgi:hypothetical protein
VDSTGIKAEGEGEWNARKHGGPKRRTWRKIHIGIDEETLEVRAVEVTTNNIGDAPMLPELLNQIPPDQDIGRQVAEIQIRIAVRNRYTALGIPVTKPVG